MRPCFLVFDQEYPGNISSRKLVIETAKLNVITVYSAHEAVETLARFPNVSGIVIDTQKEQSCAQLIDELRRIRANIQVVTVSPSGNDPCGKEQYHVSSFDPGKLLEVLRKISGETPATWEG